MSEGQLQGDKKLAQRRRKLPTAPSPTPVAVSTSTPREGTRVVSFEDEFEFKRLSPEVLMALRSTESSVKFMPGEVSYHPSMEWLHNVIDIIMQHPTLCSGISEERTAPA